MHGNLKLTNVLMFENKKDTVVKLADWEGYPGCSSQREANMMSLETRLI